MIPGQCGGGLNFCKNRLKLLNAGFRKFYAEIEELFIINQNEYNNELCV